MSEEYSSCTLMIIPVHITIAKKYNQHHCEMDKKKKRGICGHRILFNHQKEGIHVSLILQINHDGNMLSEISQT